MYIEYLREFCTLARRLNYTHAANELHESQSTLSRHIKTMEIELGFSLIRRRGNDLSLTNGGNAFLEGAVSLVENYDKLIESCRTIANSFSGDIVIQHPPYQDVAGIIFVKMLARFKKLYPNVHVSYRDFKTTMEEALKQGIVDVSLEYWFDDKELAETRYSSLECSYATVCKTSLVALFSANSVFTNEKSLSLSDMENAEIVQMYDAFIPARYVIESLFEVRGIKPIIANRAATNLLELFADPLSKNGVVILPKGADASALAYLGDEYISVPVTDANISLYAVFRPGFDEVTSSALLYQFLKSRAVEQC